MIYISKDNFPEIFRQYANMVFRVAYNILYNREESEDVVMDCFTALIEKAEFTDENHIKAWLIRVAENKAINVTRSARMRRSASLENADELAASQAEDTAELKSMVAKLPQNIRTAIYLYYYEDMSAEEIAAALHITQNAVYKRLKKGRQLLKLALEEG